MRRLATILALLLPLGAAAQTSNQGRVNEETGSWRLTCATDPMTDRRDCILVHRDWVEAPSSGAAPLALEVMQRHGQLVPAVTSRDLSLEGVARGLLALTGTVQMRFPPNPMFEMPCGLEARSLVCVPRQEDAARAAQDLAAADRVLIRVQGLPASAQPRVDPREPAELRLARTRDALARYRAVAPAPQPPPPPGLDLSDIVDRLRSLFGH